jgi:lipopolysaccharide/colanic/teichoic acid biosynthesis glycosyltransferase
MPQEVAGYEHHHHLLFSVKPGITGLAQISGRSDLDFDEEARLDLLYVENWSPFFDFIIILKTPFALMTRKSNI